MSLLRSRGPKRLTIGLVLAFIWMSGCGARSSLHEEDRGPGASASTSDNTGGATTAGGTGGSTTAGGTGGASTTSGAGGTGGDLAELCALPDFISTVWSVDLEALGLFATDMAVDPGGDIYVCGPGPFVARFDPQGNLQWVAGQPMSPPFENGESARIFLGPNGRLGLITESQARHYVVQGATLSLLGESPGNEYARMAFGPAGRVYVTRGGFSDSNKLTAMDETLAPIWTVEGTEADPVGYLVGVDALGRIVHAGGFKPANGYTTFGWLDPDGTSIFSTSYPQNWASMIDLALTADGSALVSGNGNAGQSGWLERFTPQGMVASYAETGFGNGGEALISCGMALLPSGDTWTCGALDLTGSILAHFSAEGELIKAFMIPAIYKAGFHCFLQKIGADSTGRVTALRDQYQLSALLLP